MRRTLLSWLSVLLLALVLGNTGATLAQNPLQAGNPNKLVFKFGKDLQGWTGGFADYPQGEEAFYELTTEHRELPVEIGKSAKAFFISGNNHSDDLFMFLKRRVTGFKPNTTYQLSFKVKFATNAPAGCAGVGGAPGEGVFLKVGGSTVEPVGQPQDGQLLMNIDKGNQAQGGKNAVVLGNVSGTNTNCNAARYEYKVLKSVVPIEVTTAADGSFWLLVGTDSGFEATTGLYYSNIQVQVEEK